MGNSTQKMNASQSSVFSDQTQGPSRKYEAVETFQFHDSFAEDTTNGLYFNDIHLPEEIVIMILSYIDPKEILKATLVCKKWCNIIKSELLWGTIYSREYKKKSKKLPWYVYYCLFSTDYFDKNLLKNGNGQDKFKHWKIVHNGGNGFKIEKTPVGADPLPLDVPEFNGKTSCFATSYGACNKLQNISLENNRLIQLILNQFKPHIYLSEWVAARFDCGCTYILWCKLQGNKCLDKSHTLKSSSTVGEYFSDNMDESDIDDEECLHIAKTETTIEQWAGRTWSKIELVVKDYPCGVNVITFQHCGRDTQFWAGHYGSKMAGGVVKILFDSIEPNA